MTKIEIRDLTNLEVMEEDAVEFGQISEKFTAFDILTIEHCPDWMVVEGTRFIYKHNGVAIDRERAYQLVPGNSDVSVVRF